jgi:hypothetical protein
VKTSRPTRPSGRLDRSVAWWSALLLVALATVLAALFLSARLMLSLANEGPASAQGHSYHRFATVVLLPRDHHTEPFGAIAALVAFAGIVLA